MRCRRQACWTPKTDVRDGARSDAVAVLVHAGGTARVTLALRVGLELVDLKLALRPSLLIGELFGRLLRGKCRAGKPKRHRHRQRDDDVERLELRHADLPL